MRIEGLNLNEPEAKKDQTERHERRVFSETFKAVALAGLLLFGASEGFKTAKEMAIVSEHHLAPDYDEKGREKVKGEIVTAAGKKYAYEVQTDIKEGAPKKQSSTGGGTLFDANISEITEDGSGVKIKVHKVLGRDQIEVRTDHFQKSGELEKTTVVYVDAQPQEVSVK